MKLLNFINGTTFKRSLIAAAVATGCATAASAAPLPQFTFAPSAIGGVTSPSFTADNVIVSDFATVNFTPSGTFTESGYLQISSFQLGASNFTPTGLNAAGGYSLYIPFTATGHNTNTAGNFTVGAFDTLNFTLVGAPGAVSGATANPGATTLASGSLINGSTTVLANADGTINPSANINVSFNPALTSFFTSPVPFYNVAMTAFTNTTSEVTTTATGFVIAQGGGSLNFVPRSAVPEPGTLALLGVGLLGFALRKRKHS